MRDAGERLCRGALRSIAIRATPASLFRSAMQAAYVAMSLLLTATAAFGAAEAIGEADVLRWVDQLSDASAAKRLEAERSLQQLPLDLQSALPGDDEPGDPATRDAIKRIRRHWRKRWIDESRLPSRITLQTAASPLDVMRELSQRTGNPLEFEATPSSDALPPIEVDWRNATFFAALDDLLSRASWRISNDDAPGALKLASRVKSPGTASPQATSPEDERFADWGRSAVVDAIDGPAQLRVASIEPSPWRGSADEARRVVRVRFGLRMEPRLRPLYAISAQRNWSGTRADGRSLEAWTPDAEHEIPFATSRGEIIVSTEWLLPHDASKPSAEPASPTQQRPTARIQGRVAIHLAAGSERFAFPLDDLELPAVRRSDEATIRLIQRTSDVANGQPRQFVRVHLTYSRGGPEFESHRAWMRHHVAWVESAGGDRTRFASFEPIRQGDGGAVLEYQFALSSEPGQRFVYESPTRMLQIDLNAAVRLPALEELAREAP